jgi:hypothetical protein
MNAPAPVSITDLKNPPVPRETRLPVVSPGFGDLASFELLQRGAKLLSASPLVPQIYQGADGLASCVIALNMALRMNADPLMVMQNIDVIHGRPSWRSQFLIACFNQCGRFTAMRFRWQGTEGKDDWGCRAWATEKASGEEIFGPLVTIGLAKAEKWFDRNGSKWKTIPELMLMYRAAGWTVRTHAPELAMGLPAREEIEDTIDLPRDQYTVGDVANSAHAVAAPPATPSGAAAAPPPASDLAGGFTYAQVADAIKAADTPEAIDKVRAIVDAWPDAAQKAELDVEERAKRKAISAKLDKDVPQ